MGIGDRIKAARKQRGLTQKEVAEKANISRSYLADVENNRYSPSLSMLESIAAVLEVSLDRLTGEAVSSIIEGRLEELGMTMEELVEKAGMTQQLYWLQNIDTYTPGQFGGPNDIAYTWITKIAEALGLPGSRLRAALARQEMPAQDKPTSTPEEDFRDPKDNSDLGNKNAINTIAAHLEGKDLTPQKLKLLEQYIKALFDEE